MDVANASFIYDGKHIHLLQHHLITHIQILLPIKTVKLEEGKDFEIKYFHNVTGDANDKAYIAVVGKGNYAIDNTRLSR